MSSSARARGERRPRSVTPQWDILLAVTALSVAVVALPRLGFSAQAVFESILLLVFVILAGLSLLLHRSYCNHSTGLRHDWRSWRGRLNWRRSFAKLGALYAIWLLIGAVYLLVPEYRSTFYEPFWAYLYRAMPILAVAALPYFIVMDAMMLKPEMDGYWHLSRVLLGRWREADAVELKTLMLGWAIKGFFLPVMLPGLLYATKGALRGGAPSDIVSLVQVVTVYALCFDLVFAVLGYICTLRILDTHIRSVNPVGWGWVVCLVLYKPFWGEVSPHLFDYKDGFYWTYWMAQTPWLLGVWGMFIILAKLGWVWANAMFGLRFSNLTHRGIITNGPYRWTKHPSYLCKNIAWWLISVPFLSHLGLSGAIMHCCALLGINALYYLRAVSEEIHLSEDPIYVEYALWMNKHGLLRGLARWVPMLRYRAPQSEAPTD